MPFLSARKLLFDLPRFVIALLVWTTTIALVLAISPAMIGPDDYFHIQVAEIMTETGIGFRQFPYATESIWIDRYFDKEWGFHVLLIPLLQLFGKIDGMRAAVIACNAILVPCLWLAFRAARVRNPLWWVIAIPFSVYEFYWVRLLQCRPHVLSIALLFLCLSLTITRRGFALTIGSALYALCYTGHWQLLGLTLCFDLLFAVLDDNGRLRQQWYRGVPMSCFAVAGTVLGELIHPHFPNNVRGLVIQNIMALGAYWQDTAEIASSKPAEFNSLGSVQFLFTFATILLALAAIIGHTLARRAAWNRNLYLWLTYTLIYLFMTILSGRFLEYLAPVALLLIASYYEQTDLGGWLRTRSRIRFALIAAFVLYAAGGLGKCYVRQDQQRRIQQADKPLYADAAAWLAQHLAPGEIVYTAGWDDAPPLFFGAPRLRFIVFMDPMFMYARSPDKFHQWHIISHGLASDPVSLIQSQFHSRVVFVRQEFRVLIQQLQADARAEMVFSGATGEKIFILRPENEM